MDDPVGYRFHPYEEEIMSYYLKGKLKGRDFPEINEVEFNKFEPWQLPELSAIESDDPVWYFFTEPVYMDSKRKRINRRTEAGFWKVTGRDRTVKDKRGRVIGQKKTLVFHRGRFPDGIGTNWVMQEYHYEDAINSYPKPFVLCRLKRKSDGSSDEPNPHLGSNPGNLRNANIVPQENNEITLALQSFLEDGEVDFNVRSVLQSLVQPEEQRPSCFNGSLINEIEASGSQLDTGEQDDDFVNSILAADEDVHLHEETVQSRLHDFRPEEPLSGYAAAASSNFNHVQAMSVFVADSRSGPVLGLQSATVLETPRLPRPRAQNSPRYELQMDSSTLENIRRTPRISGKASYKLQSGGSNESSRKRSFIFLHTPPSRHHEQDPPSVYILNILVGLILLLFFVREIAFLR